jgi:prophage maintenance system killer protein
LSSTPFISTSCESTADSRESGTRTLSNRLSPGPETNGCTKSAPDLAALAAAYGYGLAASHPYHDGNKRIAFLAMVMFLGLNGWDLDASESEVVSTMLAVADGRYSEPELAEWLRTCMVLLS